MFKKAIRFEEYETFFGNTSKVFGVSDVTVKAENKLTRQQQIATDLISMEHDLLTTAGESRFILFMETLPLQVSAHLK